MEPPPRERAAPAKRAPRKRPAAATKTAAKGHLTLGAEPRVPPRRLGEVGDVACSLALTTAPWDLPVDALVLSTGPDGIGELGQAYASAVGVDLSFDGDLAPELPFVVDVPAREGSTVRTVVIATVHDRVSPDEPPRPASVDAAGRAAAACVALAASRGYGRLALPLLGAGMARLDPAEVADAVVANVRAALGDLDAAGSLREVVFTARDVDTAVSIERAWQGYRSQPFTNDRPGGRDLLGVRDEVEALADMLLLRDVQPPLAVGVLGGWGSGKSFVMHLMRERLDQVRAMKLTKDQCWDGDHVSPFVGHVYPIEFNAWTYARADLWAALMQTTLTELDRQLGIERRLYAAHGDLLDGAAWRELRDVPKELYDLYEQTPLPEGADLFATLNRVHEEDRKALDAKQLQLAKLRADEAMAERDIETRADVEFAVRVKSAQWAPLRDQLGRVLGVAGDEVQKWVADAAPEVSGQAVGTVQDARQLVAALRSLRPPERTVTRYVLRRYWFAAVVFLLTVALAPVALAAWHDRLGHFTFSAGALTALTAAASFLRLARGWVAVGRRFAEQLAVWQRSVEEDVRRIEATRDRHVAAQKDADPNLAQVRTEIAQTEQDVEHLRQRVGLVGEFRTVADLVSARLGAGTYEERLGVMQQISEDLSSLSRSLTRSARDPDVEREQKAKLFPRGPARVVLFIDDLDRCPPPKVVEVLEAVQLLLATDLFVVVVAIDVRYVTKALEKVYEGVLDADGEPSGMDYLEKIIQVPYRTRALTTDAARRFLRGQLRVAAAPATSPGDDRPTTGPSGAEAAEQVAETPRSAVAVARDLLFTRDEVEVLATCCTVLGLSPRAGKRVANVTKLFRMVWARRGRATPTLDETATVALLVALAAAHPEVQRDALAWLDGSARGGERKSVIDVLRTVPAWGDGNAMFASWTAAVDQAAAAVVRLDDGGTFRIGTVAAAEVAKAISFVSAFCFVGDESMAVS